MSQDDELRELQLHELRRDIRKGIGELESGKSVPIAEVAERLKQRREKRKGSSM